MFWCPVDQIPHLLVNLLIHKIKTDLNSCLNHIKLIIYYRPHSEGYVFTGMCHSFCSTGRGGVQHQRPLDNTSPHPGTRSQHLPPPGTRAPRTRSHLPPPDHAQAGGTHPTGMRARSLHLPPPPPGPGHTSLPPTMRRRAVRILLECILVFTEIAVHLGYMNHLKLFFIGQDGKNLATL